MRQYLSTVIILFFLFIVLPVYAAENHTTMDVVLVMDSSGSMKRTDPQSLRIPAAKLFISLLGKQDQVAVLSFHEKAYPLISFTLLDNEENIQAVKGAVELVTSDGLHTNLYEALNSALNLITSNSRPDVEKIIVMMSDGLMDTGDPDLDTTLKEKISTELIKQFRENNIRVYTIAFTEESEIDLLKRIAKKSKGFFNLALTAQNFHLIFSNIFESLKQPDMLPVTENSFNIDPSIEEVTIVVTKGSPDTKITIKSPDGQTYIEDKKVSGVSWFASERFDMITISKPVAGKWEILFSPGEDNRAYIITNLRLMTNFDQLYSLFGEPLNIQIWLEKDGERILDKEVLEKIDVSIELTGPDGNTTEIKPFLSTNGYYERRIAPFTPGNYKMRIIARGKTFEREKNYIFNVATVEESKQDLKEMAEEAKKQEQPQEPKEEDKISWGWIIVEFIIINLIIGAAVFFYFRKKSLLNLRLRLKLKGKDSQEREDASEDKKAIENEQTKETTTPEVASEKDQEEDLKDQEKTEKHEKEETKLDDAEHHEDTKETPKEDATVQTKEESEKQKDATGDEADDAKRLEEEIKRLEQMKATQEGNKDTTPSGGE